MPPLTFAKRVRSRRWRRQPESSPEASVQQNESNDHTAGRTGHQATSLGSLFFSVHIEHAPKWGKQKIWFRFAPLILLICKKMDVLIQGYKESWRGCGSDKKGQRQCGPDAREEANNPTGLPLSVFYYYKLYDEIFITDALACAKNFYFVACRCEAALCTLWKFYL